MPSSSDVADKAVSTEDASSGMEVARLEAVLAALVETKVEAMKQQQQHHQHQKHRHHHHHRRLHYHEKKRRQGQKHRRHGSAPCGDSIHRTIAHHHKQAHGKGRQKSVDIPCDGQKHWRHSRNSHVLSPVIDPRFELLGIDAEHDHALMNFERTRKALSDEYQKLHQSACYISHSTAHLKSHYDEDDYLTFNFADMPGDEDTFNSPPAADSHVGNSRLNSHERFHRPRRKRKRPKLEKSLVDVEGLEVDDLPPRARWTIVATACLLLAMSLLLVGVTLRMAPIIDEMVRKENEELLNSLNRDVATPENITTLSF
ncbi:PREDICTED: uncharacterized protein LOC105365304 [Ceratosolen solmsi marchali]|uniref:Uncharacterized protein LOC105365304 n=1 Tax=Ceratosolen solmsi marchali TaxID=326594 RepID=A0AAJ7DZ46_9HYME|nr:PREDICTED: uncharacterized protein LOC105365304 [Ceratosolen solmsi marchali]